MRVKLPRQLDDPSAELAPQLIVEVIRDVTFHYFPGWRPQARTMATEPPNSQRPRLAEDGQPAERPRSRQD